MKYRRNRPVEIEAMQWVIGPDDHGDPMFSAKEIVAWINANGGEAEYRADVEEALRGDPPTIWLRVADGSAVAVPGDYIVKSFVFTCPTGEGTPAAHQVREFYPLSAEAFEARWEPVS